jgi:hypothetical protein
MITSRCLFCPDRSKGRQDLNLLGWYYMGVSRCIQEDSLPEELALLKDKSQVPHQIVLYIL